MCIYLESSTKEIEFVLGRFISFAKFLERHGREHAFNVGELEELKDLIQKTIYGDLDKDPAAKMQFAQAVKRGRDGETGIVHDGIDRIFLRIQGDLKDPAWRDMCRFSKMIPHSFAENGSLQIISSSLFSSLEHRLEYLREIKKNLRLSDKEGVLRKGLPQITQDWLARKGEAEPVDPLVEQFIVSLGEQPEPAGPENNQ